MFSFGFLLWLISIPVLATTEISSSIYEIDLASDAQGVNLILLTNGKVVKMRNEKSDLLENLLVSKKSQQTYSFVIDEDRFIIEAKPIPSLLKLNLNPNAQFTDTFTYVPTTIASMDIARKYFREARYNPKESQCFNRAMVWTYEWWRRHSLKSNKILIYFTRSFIRRYNFDWWFHIAPYVHVMENGVVVERVLDVKYAHGPLEFRKWTNLFTKRSPECPIVTKFSDYADYPFTGDCFIQRTNMYTYQPADLQMNEAWNYVKEDFILDEVKQAYLEAFDEVASKSIGE
jgi:hypothetical protein